MKINNYSWIQQKLHKFALSSKFIRESAFDLESFLFEGSTNWDNNIFISGLARSGTTILLNALHASDKFSSLSYDDMPFILAPNLWSKILLTKTHKKAIYRAHGDGLKVTTNSPEAFEEVFWKTFEHNKPESLEKFKVFIKLINKKYGKKRYISKNNQNINRIDFLSKNFPNSKILIPFREPSQQAYSLLNQHKRFIYLTNHDTFISDYMNWIGHKEFGPNYIPLFNEGLAHTDTQNINHWLEQWYLSYKKCKNIFKDTSNICFVCYEEICHNNDYWQEILKYLDINKSYNFNFMESKKNISLDTDINLYNKTSFLYDQIREISIKKILG